MHMSPVTQSSNKQVAPSPHSPGTAQLLVNFASILADFAVFISSPLAHSIHLGTFEFCPQMICLQCGATVVTPDQAASLGLFSSQSPATPPTTSLPKRQVRVSSFLLPTNDNSHVIFANFEACQCPWLILRPMQSARFVPLSQTCVCCIRRPQLRHHRVRASRFLRPPPRQLDPLCRGS